MLFLGTTACISFFVLIYLKLKLLTIRRELQQSGQIKKEASLHLISIVELVFWMIPVFAFGRIASDEHRLLKRKVNVCWVVMMLSGYLSVAAFN